MLSIRDQENMVSRHQTGAVLKQQQNSQLGSRYPKTPIKIPLNDENAGPMKGGKSILTDRARGNENAPASKGLKGLDKSNFVTPMQPRARAVLGDKTTNAKAGAATVNGKSGGKGLEKSARKAAPRPKQKQPQAETNKLQIHTEVSDLLAEEEPEYCPPKPQDIPYESDVFPKDVLTFEMLKPENLFKGYYQHYYNPVDENGVSRADKELTKKTQKALEEGERQIKEDMESFQWSIQDEVDGTEEVKPTSSATAPAMAENTKFPQAIRRPVGTVASRTAASALSMDDTTKSLQRRAARVFPVPNPTKKATSFSLPIFRGTKTSTSTKPVTVKRTPMANIEANSRSTLGYNRGRAAASVLSTGRPATTTRRLPPKLSSTSTTKQLSPGSLKPKTPGLPRSKTTMSMDSDKTITPARFASKQQGSATITDTDDDQDWKERVPFLSIFNPDDVIADDDDDFDIAGRVLPDLDDDDEFEMQIPE